MRNFYICIFAFLASLPLGAQSLQKYYSSKLTAPTITSILKAKSTDKPNSGTIHAIVRLRPGSQHSRLSEAYKIRFSVVTKELSTAVIPVDALEEFVKDPAVESVDTGNEVHAMTDLARELSHVDILHNETIGGICGLTGKGVLIGVIDTGFDFMHPAFRDAEGNSRIVNVWDQNRMGGTVSPMGYGSVLTTKEEIAKVAHDSSSDTHGTHVAAIAASSANKYKGMAPDANIVVVSSNKSEAGIIDGLAYLLDYAKNAKQPIAINLSMGTVIGFKNGKSPISSMIDELLGKNEAGTLMAIAAGNEGGRNSTMQNETTMQGEVFTTTFCPPSHMRENIFIESSTKGAFRVNLSLQNTDGKSIFSASINSDDLQSESYENILADNDYSFVALSPVKDANNKQCGVSVNLFAPLKQGQKWCLAVNGDAGNYMAYCDYGEFDKGDSISTIASTACGQLPISVGAYVSRNKFMNIDNKERSSNWVLGERYPLSGVGPTSDGRNKPDVLAPGAYIISAINNYAASYNIDKGDLVCREKDELNSKRTNFWGAMCGTSMATPVVTGIMALWLQVNPMLSHSRVRDILGEAGTYIDAKSGLDFITSSVEAVESNQKPYFYNHSDNCIEFSSGEVSCVEVYSIDGALLQKVSRPTGMVHLCKKTIQIVRIITPTANHVFKTY